MSKRRHPDDNHGLTTREAEIVECLEAGDEPGAVSRSFGVTLATVMVYKARYIIGEKQLNAFDRATRLADAAYRSALAACGGAYA